MKLQFQQYYHHYNRTNNRELLFKENENYLYFVRKFRNWFEDLLSVYAYCLMPTHSHFLIRVNCRDSDYLMNQIGTHLSSYTKAINNKYDRSGSLFQRHTKAKLIDDTGYLITLITYIHQNPVRANFAKKMKDWPFSSYRDLAGYRKGTLPDARLINSEFKSKSDFVKYSEQILTTVKNKYWV